MFSKTIYDELEKLKENPLLAKNLINIISILDNKQIKVVIDYTLKYCKDNKLYEANPWFLNEKGWVYHSEADFINAEKYHKQAYDIFSSQNNIEGILTTINALCGDYIVSRELDLAIEWCLKGIDLAEKNRNYNRLTSLKINMSCIYMSLGKYTEAKQITDEVENSGYCESRENEVYNYLNRTICEINTDNLDSAVKYIEKAYEISTKYVAKIKYNVLSIMAVVYTKKEWYEKAEEIFQEAIIIAKEKGVDLYIMNTLMDWAELNICTNRFHEALIKLNSVEEIKKCKNIKIDNIKFFSLMTKTYKGLKLFEDAYYYLEKYIEEEKIINKEQERIKNLNSKKDEDMAKTYLNLYKKSEELYIIGQKIIANLNKDEIFNIIVKEIRKFINFDIFQIAVHNSNTNKYNYQLLIHNNKKVMITSSEVKDNTFASYCINNRKEILIHEVFKEYKKYISGDIANLENNRMTSNETLLKPSQSLIFVPVIVKNEVIAMISVQRFEKNAFTIEDLTSLKILSTYIGIALENSRLYRKVVHLATYDFLTDILNRGTIIRKYYDIFNNCKNKKMKLSILMIDIDNFKKINDNYGHLYGDEVIKKVAKIIKNSIRDEDLVGRYGGEEFIVIIQNKDVKYVKEIAERVRQNVEKSNNTITIGISMLDSSDISANELIDRADMALYMAKNKGKNRVEVAK